MSERETKAGDRAEPGPAETAGAAGRRPSEHPARGRAQPPGEVNGPKGPEPTRFGDWEKNGRCSDF